jgi:ribosomal protein L18
MKITKKIFFLKKSKRNSLNSKCRLKSGTKKSFEVLILKTSKNIHVQLIRTSDMKTVAGLSTSSKDFISKNNNIKSCNLSSSESAGSLFAMKVRKMSVNLNEMYFNRSKYKFHGKVKAFWESFSSSMLLS